MGDLLQIGNGELEFFGLEEKDQASKLRDDINSLLNSIRSHEQKLGSSYIRLGRMLSEVDRQRAWIPWGYNSLAGYINSIKDQIGRERSQIFEMVAVAEKLLPQISESDLESMGISRASLLKKFCNQTMRRVPPELLAAALDVSISVAEFKAKVYNELHQEQEVKGKWVDYGFYATAEELAEIQQAAKLVPIEGNIPDWAVRREVMLSFAREFFSSNVNG